MLTRNKLSWCRCNGRNYMRCLVNALIMTNTSRQQLKNSIQLPVKYVYANMHFHLHAYKWCMYWYMPICMYAKISWFFPFSFLSFFLSWVVNPQLNLWGPKSYISPKTLFGAHLTQNLAHFPSSCTPPFRYYDFPRRQYVCGLVAEFANKLDVVS